MIWNQRGLHSVHHSWLIVVITQWMKKKITELGRRVSLKEKGETEMTEQRPKGEKA